MTSALEERLADLEREVAALRSGRRPTMRASGACPACGDRTLLHFKQITEMGGGRIEEAGLAHARSFLRFETQAPLEAYACKACGFLEWYAKNLSEVFADGTIIEELTSEAPTTPEGSPYR